MNMRKINFTETVLRDANQSLIATRLPYDKFESILETMDKAGYYSAEVWGGATFDVCLRYLQEMCIRDRDYTLLILLDTIFARGQLSLKMEASQPGLSERYLRLRGARHPLLDKKKAVANDLELGDRFDTLVITGPNTCLLYTSRCV